MRLTTPSLSIALLCVLTVGAAEPAPVALFNGVDLTGWDGDPRLWRVEGGAIVGETTAETAIKGNTFLLWTGGTVDDFALSWRARVTGANNSGVQYRGQDKGRWVVHGYQFDLNSGANDLGKLYDEGGRARIAMPGERVRLTAAGKEVVGACATAAERAALERKGDWNDYRIVAVGPLLQHYVNGALVVELTDEDEAKRDLTGIIALQLHAGAPMRVEFADLVLTPAAAAE